MLFKFTTINLNQAIHQTLRSGGFLLLVVITLPLSSLAQKDKTEDEMARDENGKYIYYEIVDKGITTIDSLTARAKVFLKVKKLKEISEENGQLNANGKLIISKTAFMLAHPSGEVLYHFVFEVKEGKYRFWLTDFVFVPYSRDRYGNFVPTGVKGTALESNPGKLNAGEWTSYISAANKQAAAFVTEFKAFLATKPGVKAEVKPKKAVSTKNW